MGRAEGRSIPLGTQLEKSLTGIKGMDEITKGGLPKGRPTLVCGGAGSGKTMLAAEFLVKGALQFGEPGVFMSFEETSDELTKNVASLGFKLDNLVAQKKISLDHIQIDRSEIEETGEYDLEGYLYALNTRSLRSVQSEWCWIPSKRSFPGYPILRWYGQSLSGCFNG